MVDPTGLVPYRDCTGFVSCSPHASLGLRADILNLFSSCTQGAFAPCSAPLEKQKTAEAVLSFSSVDPTGLEPATPSVQVRCSTR